VSAGEVDAGSRYNFVVKCAALDHVRLLNSKFDVKQSFFQEQGLPKLAYDVSTADTFFDKEQGIAFARIDLSVEAKRSRSKVLGCTAQYVIGYSGLEDCEEEAVALFLKRVGPFACYPYFRSLFASLDWAAGTRLPPLPVHRENAPEIAAARAGREAGSGKKPVRAKKASRTEPAPARKAASR
jgi:preprotein translocase subunit SecB